MKLTRLGPYKIGNELGRGGMGTVYAAISEDSGAAAAVKVLAPPLATQEGFRERFEAEIESLKQLQHPTIVRLFGFGEQDSHLYYAMELVEGTSLEEELANGRRFQWREVCQIGMDLCRALKLAHDHGIIHRDIKPANLLWSTEGRVKLTDFGIARLFGNTGLTSEGGVLGTAEYMAPEQADGRRVTHHCDLYSLGSVLYALLAGRPPFRSTSMLEMLQMQRFTEPEPVRRYAAETPAEMESIISQLLQKEPKDRFPNALMVARRLESMEKALTLREQDDCPPNHKTSMGFELNPHSNPSAENGGNSVGVTVDGMPSSGAGMSLAEEAVEVAATRDPEVARSLAEEIDHDGLEVVAYENRFTTIEEAAREAELRRRAEHPLISTTTWMIIGAIVATGVIAWYILQPPSAERMYLRISAAAADAVEDEKRLLDVEDDVESFIKHYPNDDRTNNEIRGYQSQINAIRLEQRAKLQSRILRKKYPDSPIAPDYLAAIDLAETNPEEAAKRLQLLIDLYADTDDQPASITKFIQAAKQQLDRLKIRIHRRAAIQSDLMKKRIQDARDIMGEDPQQAQRICDAIIGLYGDKDWAVEMIAEARALKEQLREAKPRSR